MKYTLLFFLAITLFVHSFGQKDVINLSGKWDFKIDPDHKGIVEKWYASAFKDSIQLPGSMLTNGKGNDISVHTLWTGQIVDSSWYNDAKYEKYRQPGNIKIPFWLTPSKHYTGPAWYKKEITVPKSWKNKRITLLLGRAHWQTQVWFDENEIGSNNSLSTPHIFEIPDNLRSPGKHRITIRIDNSINEINPGINSHSITDHTQGNWNGIVGDIALIASSKIYLDSVKFFPNIKDKKLGVKLFIRGFEKIKKGKIAINVRSLEDPRDFRDPYATNIDSRSPYVYINYPMGNNFKTWDEFNPNLYEISICLIDKETPVDLIQTQFGMREFTISGTRFRINNHPVFLRGTVENCVFPLTGYPPCNEEAWSRIFKICKLHGLNHMRFHSNCPPEAAFAAADKAGMYLQVEGPSWAKYSTSLGNGKPIDKYLYEETEKILNTYGNHPSFCMMAYGNEPSGKYVDYLINWVTWFKKRYPQQVFCGASIGRSWTIIPNSDYIVRSSPRGLDWKSKQPESTFDYGDKLENQHRPYVTHEMGQWCVFPNFDEIKKYTGPYKAKNFELFQEELTENHMAELAHDFLMASGKLQASCYKQEIEAALRTPGLAGIQLLSLNDFPGQGTALVGVLDAFWDEKEYITAREFNSFCNKVVPLVRLPKFTFTNDESLNFSMEVANFGEKVLPHATISWKLKRTTGEVIVSQDLPETDIKLENCRVADSISIPLINITTATKLVLEVSVNQYVNQWNIWVYPKILPGIKKMEVYICNTLDNPALDVLKKGGKVLLLAAGKVENGKDVEQYLTPVFWNTLWFRMRPPHTTGILVRNEHPALAEFPTDYYSDLQWWEIANRQQVMNLENFPADFRPIIEPIDTWFLNRRLAMLFEAEIGLGKLMVCSADLTSDMKNRPVARQLLYSLYKYMNSDQFQPSNTLDLKIIQELFEVKKRGSDQKRTVQKGNVE